MLHLYTSEGIYTPKYYHSDMIFKLEEILDTKVKFVSQEGKYIGVHIFFAFARELFQKSKWMKSLRGPKIMIEHDAYLNFMPNSEYYGFWTKLYKQTSFNLLLSSGKRTTERLSEAGIPTKWIPKGTNASFLDKVNLYTHKIGYFGKPILERETKHKFHFYNKRYEMSDVLKEFLPCIESEVKDFANTVIRFSAGCTNDECMEEPMAKHFEMSALGCVPIRDYQSELLELGYDENSMFMYKSFDEMMDIIDFCKKNPERLVFMQKKLKKWLEKIHG